MTYSSSDLDGVTGIVYARRGDKVLVECFQGEHARSLALDENEWLNLDAQARAAAISVRPDAAGVRYMEMICAGALASIFVIHGLLGLSS